MTFNTDSKDGFDPIFPTMESKINERMPIPLQFVIYSNWFIVSNGWGALIFFALISFIPNMTIPSSFYPLFVIPLLLINAIIIYITSNLLKNLSIALSTLLVLMFYLYIDLISGWRISSILGTKIIMGDLHQFSMFILIVSLTMTILQLILLLLSDRVKTYYLNKELYIKPRIVRNFGSITIIGGIPISSIFAYYFIIVL